MPQEDTQRTRGNALFNVGLPAVLIVIADQLTKYLVATSIPLNSGVEIIPGILDLIHVRNPGAAFGMMAHSDWSFQGFFFIAVSVAVLAGIVLLVAYSPSIDRYLAAAYASFFGGALGNLVDRIRFGEVIDFLDLHWGGIHWPAFNVADTALCVGVGLFCLHLLRTRGDLTH